MGSVSDVYNARCGPSVGVCWCVLVCSDSCEGSFADVRALTVYRSLLAVSEDVVGSVVTVTLLEEKIRCTEKRAQVPEHGIEPGLRPMQPGRSVYAAKEDPMQVDSWMVLRRRLSCAKGACPTLGSKAHDSPGNANGIFA